MNTLYFEYPFDPGFGGIRYLRVSGKPIYDAGGQFLGYRGTGTDVTDEVVTRKTEARLKDRLRDAFEGVPYQPVEKGVIDRVSRHGEAYRGEGGFAILGDDEDDLNDQDGSSGRNKHEQGANSARHGLLRGAGADELAHQQR